LGGSPKAGEVRIGSGAEAGGSVHRHSMQRVLCVGDSLTDGYYDGGTKFHPYAVKLQQLLDVPVDRIGLSGWTTSELVGGIEQEQCIDCNGKVWPGLRAQLNLHAYSHCVIMAGTNDICDTPADVTIANLQQL
jgi:lysophospholipase L1-like esterase